MRLRGVCTDDYQHRYKYNGGRQQASQKAQEQEDKHRYHFGKHQHDEVAVLTARLDSQWGGALRCAGLAGRHRHSARRNGRPTRIAVFQRRTRGMRESVVFVWALSTARCTAIRSSRDAEVELGSELTSVNIWFAQITDSI